MDNRPASSVTIIKLNTFPYLKVFPLKHSADLVCLLSVDRVDQQFSTFLSDSCFTKYNWLASELMFVLCTHCYDSWSIRMAGNHWNLICSTMTRFIEMRCVVLIDNFSVLLDCIWAIQLFAGWRKPARAKTKSTGINLNRWDADFPPFMRCVRSAHQIRGISDSEAFLERGCEKDR